MTEQQKSQDYKNMIEALLFASGRLMSIDTLIAITGASGKQVLVSNIEKLKKEYETRNSPLMIVEEKDGWKLTVREGYLPLVRKIVSETELPKTILETLAMIAWKSPVLQSEIIDIRHNKAYDHIAELEELGFIKKEKKGRSFVLKLAEKFYEYFDVSGAKDIRQVFSKVVGKAETKTAETEQKVLIEELSKQQKGNFEKTQNVKASEASPQEKLPETEQKERQEEFSELDDSPVEKQ
jgi:segregation and condensation protein B